MNEDTPWQKQLLASIGALLVVGLVVGAVAAVVILKAANVAGVGSTTAGGSRQVGPIMVDPTTGSAAPGSQSSAPTGRPGQSTGPSTGQPTGPSTGQPTGQPTGNGPTSSTPTTKPPKHKHHHRQQAMKITLNASPTSTGAFQKVTLSGSYPGKANGTLQVQSRQGGSSWSNFPVTATVTAGHYSTYIESGISGLNQFRMEDAFTGMTSNVVNVTIH